MKIIDSFSGKHAFLSNFHPSPITVNTGGLVYPTVEHFFQAHKFYHRSSIHTDIARCSTPSKAKRMAKAHAINLINWEKVKVGVMLAGLRRKFRNDELNTLLAKTGDALLIEGNNWNDKFWGAVPSAAGYIGTNLLGVLLMIVRQELHGGGFKVPILNTLWDPLEGDS